MNGVIVVAYDLNYKNCIRGVWQAPKNVDLDEAEKTVQTAYENERESGIDADHILMGCGYRGFIYLAANVGE